jgi:hypothetical protein
MTWIEQVRVAIDNVEANDSIPHKYNAFQRCTGRTCYLTLCCSPCVIWSTVFRILCCPVSCMQGHNCLSNNGCTDLTDTCISKTWNVFGAKVTIADIVNQSDEDLKAAILYAHNKIKGTQTIRTKYLIADYVFPIIEHLIKKPHYVHVYTGSLEHLKVLTPFDIENIVRRLEIST